MAPRHCTGRGPRPPSSPVDVVRHTFSSISGYAATECEDVLTKRERDMLISLEPGMSCAETAETRGTGPVTVRNAIYSVQQKLDVGTMQRLVRWSVRNGLPDD